jgi:PAS domain S-box-containing protein
MLILAVALFCGLLIFLIWNQLLLQLSEEKKENISTAIQRNSNLAVSLEQYAIRTIRNADAVLQLVKMEYEEKGKGINYDELLHRGVIDLKYFHNVGIIDDNGDMQMTYISIGNERVPNFSDREHFNFHRSHKDRLYISKPVISRTIGEGVIVLSRRIEKQDGSFGGTVAVQIKPSTFTQFYSSANLNENDIISLISPDGITYARRTGDVESFGEDISKSPLFRHVALNPRHHYFSRDAIRGIPTYFSYRKLEDYPIIATVGMSEKSVLGGYYASARRHYAFGTIITILLVLFAVGISFVHLQRKKTTRKLMISETRYRSIFENSHDAILVVQPDGNIEAMNGAACKLFHQHKMAGGEALFNGLYKNSIPEIRLSLEEGQPETSAKEEVIFTRTNNTSFTGEVMYSTYQDYVGNARFVVLIRNISHQKEMEQRLVDEQKRYERKLTRQIILAQEREREAIGHEMHDNVNQILTTIKLYLEMAMNNPAMREDLIPKSIGHIMECITEIRNLSRELSAPTLGTQSLTDSIKALIDVVSSSSGLVIHFSHDSYHTSLAKDQKLAIYRILQEQLNNIIKHAAATEVCIDISQNELTTELLISDNGKGFDLKASRHGIGLNNILSRTKVFGGEMHLDSKPQHGTRLQVRLPIVSAEAMGEPVEDQTVAEQND